MKITNDFIKILWSIFCYLVISLILHIFSLNYCYSQIRVFPQAKIFKEDVQDLGEFQDSKLEKVQTVSSPIIWESFDPICLPFFENERGTFTLMLKVANDDIQSITLKPDTSGYNYGALRTVSRSSSNQITPAINKHEDRSDGTGRLVQINRHRPSAHHQTDHL